MRILNLTKFYLYYKLGIVTKIIFSKEVNYDEQCGKNLLKPHIAAGNLLQLKEIKILSSILDQ